MKQPNRKRKLNMDSNEHLNQDECLEPAEEEKRSREGVIPLSHGSSAAAQKAWSWEQYLKEWKAIAAPVELFSKDQIRRICSVLEETMKHRSLVLLDSRYSEHHGDVLDQVTAGIKGVWPQRTIFTQDVLASALGERTIFMLVKTGWVLLGGLREELQDSTEQGATDQSFPEHENGFQIGMRLEGIDPRHPSVFCVLSVAEVCGYRLRLHFDGYLSCYDFWTNAGSPDIHPVGWCEKTKHELHIPKGYRKDKFVWMDYLKACKLQNAPKKLFRNRSSNGPMPKEFQVGMKLEAVDRKNPSLVCVATIADIVEDRLLVHFDNWDDSYDYWCDVNSPYVQPVGWCQENGRTLIAPQGYPDPENFSWTDYLEATQTNAVPAKVFKTRLPHGFLPNMKLEVVDKRNPRLIRVATIIDVDDQRIKVHFDGWDHKYDYWMDADSPDIHPIGWCDVTGHPLEVPYRANDVKILPGQAVCPTPGCRGIGHIRGPRYSGHHSAFGCPYSDMNLKKEATLHDRLREQTQANLESDSSHSKWTNSCSLNFNEKHEKINNQPRLVQEAKCLRIKGKEDIDLDNLFREFSTEQTQQALHQSVFMSSLAAHPFRDLPLCREQHCKLLPGVADIQGGEVARWTVDEVAEFVQSLLGCEEHAKCFKKEQIDGKAFLLLTQTDIVKVMKIKLGPALKIYNSILMFRHSQDLTEEDTVSGQEARG